MDPQQHSCRRWRSCLAIHNLTGATHSCKRSAQFTELPEEHWESLQSFISAMKSIDLVFKAEALHQLSLFLLYVAPSLKSSFCCPDAYTISVNLKGKTILMPIEDLESLYKVLYSDLSSYLSWLFGQKIDEREAAPGLHTALSKMQCNSVQLVLLVETLRCCIHIFPLLDFNTSLSLIAAQILASVLEQLLCLRQFPDFFFSDMNCARNQLCKTPNVYNETDFQSSSVRRHEYAWNWEADLNSLQEYVINLRNTEFPAVSKHDQTTVICLLHGDEAQIDRVEVACALLEVFMDEILLEPGLADVLFSGSANDGRDFSLAGVSGRKYMHLTREVAAVYFTLSFIRFNNLDLLYGDTRNAYFEHSLSWMSLPSAVIFLDLVLVEAIHAPHVFIVHIINTIKRLLNDRSCLMPELPEGMFLGLVASAFESAVNLYSRVYSMPKLSSQFKHVGLMNSLYDKFSSAYKDNKRAATVLKLLFDEANSFRAEDVNKRLSGASHDFQPSCFRRQGMGSNELPQMHLMYSNASGNSDSLHFDTVVIVSLVQLIGTTLFRLVMEAENQEGRSTTDFTGSKNPDIKSFSDALVYVENAKEAFKFCLSDDRSRAIKEMKLDLKFRELFYEADDLIGSALAFFIERLYISLKEGASKALYQGYLDVSKSLINLLVFTEQRSTEPKSLCKAFSFEDSHIIMDNDGTEMNGDPGYLLQVSHASIECGNHDLHSSKNLIKVEDVTSLTLKMTKKFQRRHQRIMSQNKNSLRSDETRVSTNEQSPSKALQKKNKTRDGNPYINEMISCEGKIEGESFDDLSDFIVCKEGRDYSSWMKTMYKKRRKKLQKTYWERVKAKKALISVLSSKGQQEMF